MKIDQSMHYVIGYSGGKDSTATWLYLARELKLPHVTCTFANTGHESPVTYDYMAMLQREHGLPLVKIQPILADFHGELIPQKICERLGLDVQDLSWLQEPLTMERLAILKLRFPSRTARFCTTILKLRPQLRWCRQHCDYRNVIRVAGIRAGESPARAKMREWGDDKLLGCPLWLPLIKWSAEEVFAIHKKYGVPPNPLYKQGFSRVGCFPCIMSRKSELRQLAIRYPEAFDELAAMESRVAKSADKPVMTFFSSDKTAKRYRNARCDASGKAICTAEDVRRWASGNLPRDITEGALAAMFDEEPESEPPASCESEYGLCE